MLTGFLANLNNSALCGDARVVNKPWPGRTEETWFDSRQGHESLCPPKRADRLWGQPSISFDEYGTPSSGWSKQVVKLFTDLHLVRRQRIIGVIPPHTHAFMAYVRKFDIHFCGGKSFSSACLRKFILETIIGREYKISYSICYEQYRFRNILRIYR